MTKKNNKPPIILPLLLGVAGLAALVTAVALVQPLADAQTAEKIEAMAVQPVAQNPFVPIESGVKEIPVGQPVAEEQPVQKTLPEKDAGPSEKTEEPVEETQEAQQPEEGEAPASLEPSDGPWTLILTSNYKTDPAGDAALTSMVAILKSNPSTTLHLLGVNSPKKSSKRAKQGANKIREQILKLAQINRIRVKISSEQRSEVDGLVVIAEIKGGGK